MTDIPKIRKKLLDIYILKKESAASTNLSKNDIYELPKLLTNLKLIEDVKWIDSEIYNRFILFVDKPNTIPAFIYHITVSIFIIASIHLNFYTMHSQKFDFVVLSFLLLETISRIFIGLTVKKHFQKIKYIFSFSMIIDYYIISSICALYYLETTKKLDTVSYKFILTSQSIKLLHFDRYLHFLYNLFSTLIKYKKEIFAAYGCCLFLVFNMAFVFYYVESQDFSDIDKPNSIYWSTMAFLTFGFGDVVPRTFIGRIVVTLISATLLVMGLLPPAVVGYGMAENIHEAESEKIDIKLEISAAKLLQRFWHYKKSLAKKYIKISNIELNKIVKQEKIKNEKLFMKSNYYQRIMIKENVKILEKSENIILISKNADSYIITSTDIIGDYAPSLEKSINSVTRTVQIIKYLYMLIELDNFKQKFGFLQNEDDFKFLSSAIKSFGSDINRLTKRKQTRDKAVFNLKNSLKNISTKFKNTKKIYDEVNTIKNIIAKAMEERNLS